MKKINQNEQVKSPWKVKNTKDKMTFLIQKDSFPEEMFQEWRSIFEKHFKEHFVLKRTVRMQM